MAHCRSQGGGNYAGGDAPGQGLETMCRIHERPIAGLATDIWDVEGHTGRTGCRLGRGGGIEFMCVGPPLPFTGAVGSPLNPLAIK